MRSHMIQNVRTEIHKVRIFEGGEMWQNQGIGLPLFLDAMAVVAVARGQPRLSLIYRVAPRLTSR